jgi:4-diphosphocytidyl-2-C-methyl-D-erythritol kinase
VIRDRLPTSRYAPAKINLTLAVVASRDDGYHDLESLVLRIGLADQLTAAVLPLRATFDPEVDRLSVEGEPGLETPDNLVLRAVRALRRAAGRPLAPLGIRLRKEIPPAAGLGGGSSDAAAAIDLAAAAWGVPLTLDNRLRLADELGSDVPFFVTGAPAAVVGGRGEGVTPLPAPLGGLGLVLVTPRRGLSTTEVFTAYDRIEKRRTRLARRGTAVATATLAREVTAELARALDAGCEGRGLLDLPLELREANDLWPAALSLMPGLDDLREALERRLGRPVLMTGSGPTLVALYPSVAGATRAARELTVSRTTRGEATIIAGDLSNPDPTWRTR